MSMQRISTIDYNKLFYIKYYIRLMRKMIFICIVFILSSCTVPLTCALYNNTTNDISIIKIDINGSEKKYSLKAGKILKLRGWSLYNYKVLFKDVVWYYDPITPASNYEEFVEFGRWGKSFVKAQLEIDGSIFLLLKDQIPPINNISTQPEGYPLLPK